MANMHLVTGFAGQGHIKAEDHGSFQAAIFGTGQYVLDRGSKFAATIITNNQIRVADGDLLIQGRHGRLNEGSYVDLTIENGAQDMLRHDLIVARYTKDADSGVEECNLVVIKGTAVEVDPQDPAYTAGDIINDHVLVADMPLYRVPLNGLNVQDLVPLFNMGSVAIGESAITSSNLANNAVTASKIADGAVTKYFTATIGTTWQGSAAPYTQEIAVTGMLASDKPIVDLVASTNFDTAEVELEDYAKIYKITTAAGSITVYANDPTTQNLNIQMVVTRR